jgi:L-iditol 2-dehydrogenase
MCANYDYVGSRRDGAFAEYVTAPAHNLIVLPDSVSFEEAAMLEPLAVAANAMRMGSFGMNTILTLDKPVAVCGLGTIGLMVVMFLKEAGFKNIYVIGNKDSQLKRAKALGIPEKNYCDSRVTNVTEWLKESSKGGIVSYFECVGKNECMNYGIEAAAPGGWMILVGNPHSDMNFSKDIWWKILRKQMALYGIWNSLFRQEPYEDEKIDDWNYALKRIKEDKIRPTELISHRFDLCDLEKGLHIMRDKTEDYCKVIINIG